MIYKGGRHLNIEEASKFDIKYIEDQIKKIHDPPRDCVFDQMILLAAYMKSTKRKRWKGEIEHYGRR